MLLISIFTATLDIGMSRASPDFQYAARQVIPSRFHDALWCFCSFQYCHYTTASSLMKLDGSVCPLALGVCLSVCRRQSFERVIRRRRRRRRSHIMLAPFQSAFSCSAAASAALARTALVCEKSIRVAFMPLIMGLRIVRPDVPSR